MKNYPHIFEPGKLGTRTVKNRIFMSPMGDNMANEDGSVSEQHLAYFGERAKNGVGMIIPGVVCVDYPRGKSIACQLRLDQIKYIKGWHRLANVCHRYGAVLLPQLHHVGMSTDAEIAEGLEPFALSEDIDSNQKQLIGTKPKSEYVKIEKHVLTNAEIKELEQKFIKAAKYAQMADCDGVEIHGGAHYLIGSFLQPGTNFRTDEYGGSLENRLRFAVNVIRGIREACGKDFIIGIKMVTHQDNDENNAIMAKAYEEAGVDFIDAGFPYEVIKQTQSMESYVHPEGARVNLARNIKKHVSVPVLVTGNFKTPEFTEKTLTEGSADFVGLGRPLICDPEWVKKAEEGRSNEIRKCLSCCECAGGNQYSRGLKCAMNPEMAREYDLKLEPPSLTSKKVVIVGGGIAGMQAAITATKRGHKVTILEKTGILGGQMHIACVPPNKSLVKDNAVWFAEECERLGIDIRLNTEATFELIKELEPDHVMLAMGSAPFIAPIPGVENTVHAWDLLAGKVAVPKEKTVTVIGGGIVGCETAEYLEHNGNKVTILEMLPEMAAGLFWMVRAEMLEDFEAWGIEMHNNVNVKSISDTNVVVYEKDGQEISTTNDMVVLCTGQKPVVSDLPELLDEAGIKYDVIGDGKKAGRFVSATTDGFYAALNL